MWVSGGSGDACVTGHHRDRIGSFEFVIVVGTLRTFGMFSGSGPWLLTRRLCLGRVSTCWRSPHRLLQTHCPRASRSCAAPWGRGDASGPVNAQDVILQMKCGEHQAVRERKKSLKYFHEFL